MSALRILIYIIRLKRRFLRWWRFHWYGATMKFQVQTGRVGNDMQVVVLTPHGRKWKRTHTHNFVIDTKLSLSEQMRSEVHVALGNAGITSVDKVI